MDQTQRPPLNRGPGRLDPHLDHQRKRETPRHVWHTTADEILATPVGKNPQIHAVGIPAARLAGVVDRAGKLSDELLKSLETSERAAIEAVGRFVITIEEALAHEVTGTADVAKLITESGLEMAADSSTRSMPCSAMLLTAPPTRCAVTTGESPSPRRVTDCEQPAHRPRLPIDGVAARRRPSYQAWIVTAGTRCRPPSAPERPGNKAQIPARRRG
jgi:hypothetical protein